MPTLLVTPSWGTGFVNGEFFPKLDYKGVGSCAFAQSFMKTNPGVTNRHG